MESVNSCSRFMFHIKVDSYKQTRKEVQTLQTQPDQRKGIYLSQCGSWSLEFLQYSSFEKLMVSRDQDNEHILV